MITEMPNLKALQEIGALKVTPCSTADFENNGFQKLNLDQSQKSQMNFLFSQMANLSASNTLAQAYIVEFPEGVPHKLMKLHRGGYTASVMGEKGIVAQAAFHPLEYEAVIMNAFSVMSIATGQYFLCEINKEFNMINQKIDKIVDFLYGDKKAELMAEVSFVQYAYKNYSSMMSHEAQRVATIASLQESRKIAMKDIEFYLRDLDSKVNTVSKSYSEFEALSNEAFQIRDSLDLAMQLYVMSSVMEVYFAQNNDRHYLDALKDDMLYFINKCDKRILSNFSSLRGRIGNFKPNLISKFDTDPLDHKFEELIDSLSVGEYSPMQKTVNTALSGSLQANKYYLSQDGEIWIKNTDKRSS